MEMSTIALYYCIVRYPEYNLGMTKRYTLKMKAHFENESTFRKWKHILKLKAHFENESTFWKWKHIWKWKHVLKMKAHFETV